MVENEVIEEKTEKGSTYLIPIPIFSSMEWVMNPKVYGESRGYNAWGTPKYSSESLHSELWKRSP